jgi:hypothetical protein
MFFRVFSSLSALHTHARKGWLESTEAPHRHPDTCPLNSGDNGDKHWYVGWLRAAKETATVKQEILCEASLRLILRV